MKKLIASAAVAASVAIGGLAVASVNPISVAGAETALTAEALPHDGQRAHRILRGIVTTSAEAIGVSPRELCRPTETASPSPSRRPPRTWTCRS